MTVRAAQRPPLTPRFWPGWLGVGFLWLLGQTPQPVGVALSLPLGWLLRHLMKRRRRIAERNIERCFPEWSAERRATLMARCFRSVGRMLFEIAWSWSASERRLRRMGNVEGMEMALAAIARGRGVIVITAHLTCLEIGARLAALSFPTAGGMYRPLRSPVLEWYQNRSRLKYTQILISKNDMRSAVRFLRNGGVLWYAPDQDFGARQSVFAPFFGVPTATLAGTARLVEMTGSLVLPMFPVFDDATRRYMVRFFPPLEDFPTGDVVADLTRINAMFEEQVRRAPEQYWWIHRRFKTRPAGEPPFYD
jgi:KDO2-lipid IV(A) lauroyltransferase